MAAPKHNCSQSVANAIRPADRLRGPTLLVHKHGGLTRSSERGVPPIEPAAIHDRGGRRQAGRRQWHAHQELPSKAASARRIPVAASPRRHPTGGPIGAPTAALLALARALPQPVVEGPRFPQTRLTSNAPPPPGWGQAPQAPPPTMPPPGQLPSRGVEVRRPGRSKAASRDHSACLQDRRRKARRRTIGASSGRKLRRKQRRPNRGDQPDSAPGAG